MPTVFVSTWIKRSFTRLHKRILLSFVAAREHALCKIDIRNFHSRCLIGEMKYQCFLLMNAAFIVAGLQKFSLTLGVFPHFASF